MKRPIRILLALYPKKWRDRYGTELEALLEDVEPRSRDLADLAWGGIKMQMANWRSSSAPSRLRGSSSQVPPE